MGCYKNDRSNPEFNSFASHLDPSQITPELCSKACTAVQYTLSAITNGQWCFCKMSATITSTKLPDSACTMYPCAGSSSLYCGSNDTWMVYEAGTSNRVSIFLNFK